MNDLEKTLEEERARRHRCVVCMCPACLPARAQDSPHCCMLSWEDAWSSCTASEGYDVMCRPAANQVMNHMVQQVQVCMLMHCNCLLQHRFEEELKQLTSVAASRGSLTTGGIATAGVHAGAQQAAALKHALATR